MDEGIRPVHPLHHRFSDEGKRRPQLIEFIKTYKSESAQATIEAVFGPSLDDTQREFNKYVDRHSYFYMKQPVKPAQAPPSLQPAPAAVVEAALSRLALGVHRYELAREHADKAIALDEASPAGHELLAYIELENRGVGEAAPRDFEEAVKHAEAALQRGSKDSELFVLRGDSYGNAVNSVKPDAKRVRIGMYENAINLSPRRLGIYERLAEALVNFDEPREEDAKFLGVGLRIFPGEDWLRVVAAVVDYRLGHREAATASMEKVLRPNSTLGNGQREFAQGVRRSWLIDDMRSEMSAAVDKHDIAGARATVDRYRERLAGDAEAESYLNEVEAHLELQDLMNQYQEALRSRNKSKQSTIAGKLLAREDLPGNMRDYVQKREGKGK